MMWAEDEADFDYEYVDRAAVGDGLPAIEEISAHRTFRGLANNTRAYRMGECVLFVAAPTVGTGWQLTCGHMRRDPTLAEMLKARAELIPRDVVVAMILPPAGAKPLPPHTFTFVELREQRPAGQ